MRQRQKNTLRMGGPKRKTSTIVRRSLRRTPKLRLLKLVILQLLSL